MFPSEVQSIKKSVNLSSIIPNSHPLIADYSQIYSQKTNVYNIGHNQLFIVFKHYKVAD